MLRLLSILRRMIWIARQKALGNFCPRCRTYGHRLCWSVDESQSDRGIALIRSLL